MIKRITIVAALVLALGACAFADTITLTGVGGNNAAGVYVYPYYLTDTSTSGSTSYSVACDSYFNTVNPPQTWTGTVNTWATLGQTMFGSNTSFDAVKAYTEAAYLFAKYVTNPSTAAAANFAIWSLFVGGYTSTPSSSELAALQSGITSTGANSLISAANNWYASASDSQKAMYQQSLLIFTPDQKWGAWGTTAGPQEYIAMVPEPGSLLLFGMGLVASFGALKRKAGIC